MCGRFPLRSTSEVVAETFGLPRTDYPASSSPPLKRSPSSDRNRRLTGGSLLFRVHRGVREDDGSREPDNGRVSCKFWPGALFSGQRQRANLAAR